MTEAQQILAFMNAQVEGMLGLLTQLAAVESPPIALRPKTRPSGCSAQP